MNLSIGDAAPRFVLEDIFGSPIRLENFTGKKIFVGFHRFAACPYCNLRTEQIIQYAPIWQSRGLEIISFFQSPAESILRNVGQQKPPYPIIGDPDRIIYEQYGVESNRIKAAASVPKTIIDLVSGRFHPTGKPDGDTALIPADFLINPDLTIHTVYYGKSIADHLPIKQIIDFVEN